LFSAKNVRSLCLALTNTEGSNARKQLFVVYMEATLGAMELITVNLINIKTAPPSHAHRHTPTQQTAFVVGKTEMSPRRSVCVCVSFVLLGGDKHLFPHKSALQMRCMFADHKSSPQTPVKKKSRTYCQKSSPNCTWRAGKQGQQTGSAAAAKKIYICKLEQRM